MPSSPGLWVWLGRGRYCLGRVQLEEERAAGRGVGALEGHEMTLRTQRKAVL